MKCGLTLQSTRTLRDKTAQRRLPSRYASRPAAVLLRSRGNAMLGTA